MGVPRSSWKGQLCNHLTHMSPMGTQGMLTSDTTNHGAGSTARGLWASLWPPLQSNLSGYPELPAWGIIAQPTVGVHMMWGPDFSEATGADLWPLSAIHLPERCWLGPRRQGRGEALMCSGPSQAPAAPPLSPTGLKLSGAGGGDYEGGGCQMLPSMLPSRGSSAHSLSWTSGALEGRQG